MSRDRQRATLLRVTLGSSRSSSTSSGRDERVGVIDALPIAFESEAALARAVVQRQPTAARAVWERFSTLVRGLLRRMLGSHAEVEDHVQDVFLRFFKDADNLRYPSKLRSFIVGITMRVARGELRRRRVRRWLRLADDGKLPERQLAPADFGAAEALAHLEVILDRLDPSSREVFVLRRVEGMPLLEVAEALGCSPATVKRRYARSHKRIMAAVERDPALTQYLDRSSRDE